MSYYGLRRLVRFPAFFDDAACANADTDLFYDEKREAEAKAVCMPCPVRTECLDWALSFPESFGVWGGMTATQRARRIKGICHHCGDAGAYAKGLCQLCYEYKWTRGVLPPPHVLERRTLRRARAG